MFHGDVHECIEMGWSCMLEGGVVGEWEDGGGEVTLLVLLLAAGGG